MRFSFFIREIYNLKAKKLMKNIDCLKNFINIKYNKNCK